MSKTNVPSSDDSYRLWPQVRRVSKCPMRPKEYLEPPDDTFATLYALGFRKPGYSPSPSEAQASDEMEEEELSPTETPPLPPQAQSPAETHAPMTPETTKPTTEEDYGIDFDFKHPDE